MLVADLGLETAITWDIFKHELNQYFFPKVVQEAKAREFLDLVQRSISVIEYAAKFLQLSWFGMYLILNEKKKFKKFKWGLNTHIWTMMTYFDICDFSELVDRALVYEESLKQNTVEYVD